MTHIRTIKEFWFWIPFIGFALGYIFAVPQGENEPNSKSLDWIAWNSFYHAIMANAILFLFGL